MLANDIEYYCQSCGTYTASLSNITALQICDPCAAGSDQEQEDTILFI